MLAAIKYFNNAKNTLNIILRDRKIPQIFKKCLNIPA